MSPCFSRGSAVKVGSPVRTFVKFCLMHSRSKSVLTIFHSGVLSRTFFPYLRSSCRLRVLQHVSSALSIYIFCLSLVALPPMTLWLFAYHPSHITPSHHPPSQVTHPTSPLQSSLSVPRRPLALRRQCLPLSSIILGCSWAVVS